MLSPKMQRTVRVNDSQLVMLSDRAHYDHSQSGYLHKRTADSGKWQLRWFVLYQNLLFYYETEGSGKPSGVLLLEGCYCERLITSTQTQSAALAAKLNKQQDPERQLAVEATKMTSSSISRE
ncbi:ras-specific guanine nucleotide-releasing factor 1-like [Ctenocephalides felis]|uniref:ras-specific guanine nucleotide-releasing factor 1-like n=1 Tax=Ctenocephalides felis TaxID=7515 RepID=UPI000E6E3FE5|nr:ras-specific guanine nucleotide-releasing factor 1-like [Ctenocephalides felis]